MASEISVGLAVLAAVKTEEGLKEEEQHRQLEEKRRREEQAARALYIEKRRVVALDEILTELDELDRLSRIMTLLAAQFSAEPTPRVSAFLTWAREHLAKREAQLAAHTMERHFNEQHLFGDDDDREYWLSKRY